jgi:aromatic ring-opening dioxygenase catalytic subunit (LigB family)
VPGLAVHLIETLTSDGFDVAQTSELPMGPQGSNSIQHAFGFVYRRIMCDDVVPNVPIIVNTHYPPNRPSPARCVAFGTSLAQAIASWPQDMRVVVIASGGLTHYVIDEDFDRGVLDAMSRGDLAFLASIEENMLQSGGTAELKNWLPVAAAMKAAGLAMNLIDYVPCYRSEAGTGAGMAFATWSKSGEVSGP